MPMQLVKDAGFLSDEGISGFISEALDGKDLDDKSVLFIIPDSTRSMPLPAVFRALHDSLHSRVSKMDFIVALGTHPEMSEDALNNLVGITQEERDGKFGDVGIFNHEWQNPDALTCAGTLTEDDIAEISGGLMRESVDVTVNKRVFEYDVLCIVGPVFPHEVVGFSGGNKYLFPGIAGKEIIDIFHWLGALITNPEINGTMHTPVRDVVNRCAAFVEREKLCFCFNVTGKDCKGVFFGSPEEAWEDAAKLALQTHILYKDKPFKSVLAMAPEMYDELWVAGKCMYKLEPVVADGGELIIYAPHLSEVSVTHGENIKKIGYHIRDYFLAQMEKFTDIPGGVLAHSTHVRGIGAYEDGVEKPRVQVTLATGIPEEECKAINLGYRDPAGINPDDWKGKEDEGLLLVPHAGEILYKLKE